MDQILDTGRGREVVDSIKERISIADIISRYIQLTPGGKNLKGCCPLHGEKTPSFYVSPAEGYWKCFGCGKGGDVITFIQEIEKVSFREALIYLGEIAGIDVHRSKSDSLNTAGEIDSVLFSLLGRAKQLYMQQLAHNPEVTEYLVSRGVSQQMIEKFQIGYAPDEWQTLYNAVRSDASAEAIIASGLGIQGKKGIYDRFRSRIMFPTHDIRDRVVTFSGRIWSATGNYTTERPDAGKYVNGPESPVYHKSRVLYGINLARVAATQKKRLILVEGHLDCILSHQVGLEETVAVGGTALTEDHVKVIQRYCNNVVLAFDGDSAGQKAILRSLPVLYEHDITVTVARFPAGTDPADMAQNNSANYRNAIDSATDYVTHRMMLLQSEGMPLADIDRILRQEIYPLLALIKNPLLLDTAIGTIARATGTSSDSIIREHIHRERKRTESNVGEKRPVVSGAKSESVMTIRDMALRIVVVWQELQQDVGFAPDNLIQYLQNSTGMDIGSEIDLAQRYTIAETEYHLKFQWLYGGQKPQDIMPVILKQFVDMYIRDTMQRYSSALHQVVDDTERTSLENSIVALLEHKRYSETHTYGS